MSYKSAPKSAVLFPLYIYPLPGAWEPLHEAISEHPDLSFTIVLNPHNGPGSSPFPDNNYAREIPRLNCRPNVCTIGYVRIDYCKRDLTEVRQQIATYAGWSKDYARSGLGVRGIFFDETPNLYSDHMAAYLSAVGQDVKNALGILGSRLVIHNPGTVPDPGFAKPGPDATAVVEESYERYQSAPLQSRLSSLLCYDRNRCIYIVHSVPGAEVKRLVLELRHRGAYVFVTDLNESRYVQFGSSWRDFLQAIAMQNIENRG